MANDDNEQWHLPEPLRITNPQVALAAAQMQKDLSKRVVSPFARLSPEQFARSRAQGRIEHLSRALQQVDRELRTRFDPRNRSRLKEARQALAIRLAENFAVIGRYDLAVELDPRPEYQREYAKHLQQELRVNL